MLKKIGEHELIKYPDKVRLFEQQVTIISSVILLCVWEWEGCVWGVCVVWVDCVWGTITTFTSCYMYILIDRWNGHTGVS